MQDTPSVELHGFLSYLANLDGDTYRIFGYKGKQVRDNIHSRDVARFIVAFSDSPRCGEVYQPRWRKTELLLRYVEAFEIVEALTGKRMSYRIYRRQ